ncbi:hypothetical protein KC460_03900 [Candidatus Dependentiae bacterium]|nr:hypothetical protein [Candidatus Dependentiae bacterium]
MLVVSDIVAVFFRLANFAMLIALCVYLFKKYIYQSLRDQIAQKCVFIRGLENKMTALERQKDELHVQIVQQQTKCKKLMQDIAVWQQAVIHEQEKAEKERQASADEQSKRVAVQTAYLEAERLRGVVLPQAIGNAQKQLHILFQESDAGRIFTKDILTQLQQSVHKQRGS